LKWRIKNKVILPSKKKKRRNGGFVKNIIVRVDMIDE
jgi:hypothetical protein